MLIHRRRLAQAEKNLGAVDGEAFAGADVKRHAPPSPGINLQLERSESFDFGIGRHAGLLAVAAELAAHQIPGYERGGGFEHLHFFVPDRFAVRADRRLHSQICEYLEKMVLNYIADGADLLIKRAAALDTKILCHGDLDALEMHAVPARL